MLPALIDGQDHPWKDLYSPARLPTHAVGHAVAENAATIAQYRDWVMPHHHVSVENLMRGQGVVVRDGIGRPRAVYRDESGMLHWRSAVCPHLQGVVRWNPGEKSWDCPCHGSRFDCKGRAINGPALGDLGEVPDHRETQPETASAEEGLERPGSNVAGAL
jgi:Rieske Fe-S protein